MTRAIRAREDIGRDSTPIPIMTWPRPRRTGDSGGESRIGEGPFGIMVRGLLGSARQRQPLRCLVDQFIEDIALSGEVAGLADGAADLVEAQVVDGAGGGDD